MKEPEVPSHPPDTVAIGFYAVAFLDLLGHGAILKALDALPEKDDPASIDSFQAQIKLAFGTINSMQQSVARFFEGYKQGPPSSIDLPGITELRDQTQLPPVKFQRFSDGLVLFVALARSDNTSAQNGVCALLGACATNMLVSLAAGRPIRGGIDVGLGMEMNENEIYGAAVAKAYELEHAVAQMPRIVIGNSMMNFLNTSADIVPKTNRDRVNQGIAKVSLSILCEDVDGRPILDYLGEPFRRHVAVQEATVHAVTKAYEFVVAQTELWAREKNTKLALRYTLLRDYFDARMKNWQESSQ